MEQMRQFLRDHDMDGASLNPVREGGRFRKAMYGTHSGLLMLPTYLSCRRAVPEQAAAAVLDLGGTHLRAGLVRFEGVRPVLAQSKTAPMPGTEGELSWEGFLARLADFAAPFCGQADRLGVCFSFPARITPEVDGEILNFNKEIRIRGAEGRMLCRALTEELASRHGILLRRAVLLNDTTASLMGGCAAGHHASVGFILGTGLNCCYEDPVRGMIVNTESGGYDGFERGDYHRLLDERSANPGDHQLEKMVSGAYLGGVIRLTLEGACKEGLFSDDFARGLAALGEFDMRAVSALLDAGTGPLLTLCSSDADRARLLCAADACLDTAGKLLAIMLSAAIDQARCEPVVMAEGSTFWKCAAYREKITHCLQQLVPGQEVRFEQAENANLFGAALAAVTA